MYVCVCQAVTDGEIREAAAEGRVRTLPDLRKQLGVASRCGRCAQCAMECLTKCRRELGLSPCPGRTARRRSHSRTRRT
jgi:bacterioferritin-associated ferredoxin